jgi:hypothetical protein
VKKRTRKNLHAVAPGRLGGLVRSEAKKWASRENGRKGGLVKSPQEKTCRSAKRRRPRPERPQGTVSAAISSIRARFGYLAIGWGYGGIRFSARVLG